MEKKYLSLIYWLLFALINFGFWFLRLYRFPELMTFHLDQGLQIREVWEMVQDRKLRLIGPMVSTRIFKGRGFFIGPQYYYLLAILGIVTRWDVVAITYFFIFFLWLAGMLMFLFLKKNCSWLSALFALGIYSFCPWLIKFSRLFWNPNILPFLSVPYFYILYLLIKKELKTYKFFYWLSLGIVTGLGISFHYMVCSWMLLNLIVLSYFLLKRKAKLIHGFWLFFGVFIGNLPLIIFEIRHNFYNLRTIFLYLQNVAFKGEAEGIDSYYLFHLIIGLLTLSALVFNKIEKKVGQITALFLLVLIVSFLGLKNNFKLTKGTGMPDGWNIKKQQSVANFIKEDINRGSTKFFEVATIITADKRGDDLRWWLIKNNCPAMGYADYPQAKVLYLVGPDNLVFENKKWYDWDWEVYSLWPFRVTRKIDLKDKIMLYKLVNIDQEKRLSGN